MKKYSFILFLILWLGAVAFSGIPEDIKKDIYWVSVVVLFVCVVYTFFKNHFSNEKLQSGTFVDSEKSDGQNNDAVV